MLTPLFMLLVMALRIDPIYFGIVYDGISRSDVHAAVRLEHFCRTIRALGVPLDTIYCGVLRFAVVQIAALLIITYWPGLSLYLTAAL